MTPNRGAKTGPPDSFSRGLGLVSVVVLLAAIALAMLSCGGKDPTTPSADQASNTALVVLQIGSRHLSGIGPVENLVVRL
jgi:hypothetical protein